MASPWNLAISDFPQLGRLINGQRIKLEVSVTVGSKTLTGQGEYITLQPEVIEIEEEDKPSIQEILLASMNESLNRQNTPTP